MSVIKKKELFITLDIETMKRRDWNDFHQKEVERKISMPKDIVDPEIYQKVFDTVVLLNPSLSEILSVGIKLDDDLNIVYYREKTQTHSQESLYVDKGFSKEDNLLYKLSQLLITQERQYQVRYITFNGLDFDARYLLYKMIKYDVARDEEIDIGLFDFTRYQKKPHFDMMMWLCNWQTKHAQSLQSYAKDFDIETPIKDARLNKEFSLEECYLSGNYKKITEYSKEDVNTEKNLFNKIKPYYWR